MSGTVALLAAFQGLYSGYCLFGCIVIILLALGNTYGSTTAQRPSVFHFFMAESWGYSGSKKYVKDVMDGNAVYNRSQVVMLVEPKQVGSKLSNRKLHIHQESNNRVVTVMENSASKVNATITVVPPLLGIPPSSSMSYLLQVGRSSACSFRLCKCVILDS
jgi:Nicastrin